MNGFEVILPFPKPIEHLILDDSISEIMLNGPDQIFIEKAAFLQPVEGVSLGEKSLLVAVKTSTPRPPITSTKEHTSDDRGTS